MSSEVRVRVASTADVEHIAWLLREAFAEFKRLYTPEAFGATTPCAKQIRRRFSEGPAWVAEQATELIGTVSAVPRHDGIYVRSLAVAPTARRCGAATLLLTAVTEFALAQRAARIYLTTTPFLTAAIRLYAAAGFIRTSDPPHQLFGTPLFTMEKTIPLVELEQPAQK